METYRMWKLCRFFKEIQIGNVMWDNRRTDRTFSNTGELVPEWLQKYQDIIEQTREPRVLRALLIAQFGANQMYDKEKSLRDKPFITLGAEERGKRKESNQEMTRKYATDAQFIMSNCIASKFINEDEEDKKLIYLTLKGTKFATRYSLLKEWVLDDIGELKITIGLVVAWVVRELIPHLINLYKTHTW